MSARWGLLIITTIGMSLVPVVMATASVIVVKNTGSTLPAAPYLNPIQIPDEKTIQTAIQRQANTLKAHPIKTNPLLYPSRSQFTVGKVEKHKLVIAHFSSVPIFVVGNDAYSVKWAKENATYLKHIHAFGIITNVDNDAQTASVEKQTGLTLIPENVDGLEKIVNTTHYPFLIYQHKVLQ